MYQHLSASQLQSCSMEADGWISPVLYLVVSRMQKELAQCTMHFYSGL